mmetsp:Transcript_14229/g.43147  ORF Transcript_14229/g.43147 Transcript_14229/m.43147 type:complete len:207 (-) Transcript_14229:479-1099(-)
MQCKARGSGTCAEARASARASTTATTAACSARRVWSLWDSELPAGAGAGAWAWAPSRSRKAGARRGARSACTLRKMRLRTPCTWRLTSAVRWDRRRRSCAEGTAGCSAGAGLVAAAPSRAGPRPSLAVTGGCPCLGPVAAAEAAVSPDLSPDLVLVVREPMTSTRRAVTALRRYASSGRSRRAAWAAASSSARRRCAKRADGTSLA